MRASRVSQSGYILSPKGARYGAEHGRAVLTIEDLEELKQDLFLRKKLMEQLAADGMGVNNIQTELFKAGFSYAELAEKFGLGKTQIFRIDKWEEWEWTKRLEQKAARKYA